MPRQKIQDEFADMNISRQRRYQLRQAKLGRCETCGGKRTKDSPFCAKHKKVRAQRRKELMKSKKNPQP